MKKKKHIYYGKIDLSIFYDNNFDFDTQNACVLMPIPVNHQHIVLRPFSE